MALTPGTQLGPYTIVSLLGAGGMGEVYRARDSRLERDVAIKILPPAVASDPDRLHRFEQEARAAGSLNHPNIVGIFDVGSHDGAPYEIAELLEGETLRNLLAGGPLPTRKAVEVATQVARGLAAAHDKGIVHRDLKPENLFVTREGRVKILDFGLAKLRPDATGDAGETQGATVAAATGPGVVLGTTGYMSPEQVRGLPCDHRTDIFALGVVLYEMISGKHAFHRESSAETMVATLREDPPALAGLLPSVAPGLVRIVDRCLEKAVEARFQSASDLAFALESLSGATGMHAADSAVERVTGAGPRTAQAGGPRFRQLTFRRGHVLSARFAPDGNTVLYSARWGGAPLEVFSNWPGQPESRSLGFPGSGLLAVSSQGEMALSLRSIFPAPFVQIGTLARAPLAGGGAREIADLVYSADWSPDGRTLAIARRVSGKTLLEWPVGTVRYQTPGSIDHLRVSPSGELFAFNHHPERGDSRGCVMVVDLAGKARILSDGWSSATGLAWSPRGDEIWFTAMRTGHDRHLRAVSLAGEERTLLAVPGWLTLHEVGRDGKVLVTHETNRREIIGLAPGAREEADLSWHDWSYLYYLSADGRTVLFTEQAAGGGEAYSVYIRGTDGSAAVRLGDGDGMQISPDGRWVLALTEGATRQIVLLPTGAGEPRIVTPADVWIRNGAWHPDGTQILYLGRKRDANLVIWVLDVASGESRPLEPSAPAWSIGSISPDGRFLFATTDDGRRVLYRVDGGEPVPISGVDPTDLWVSWCADSRSVYLSSAGELPARVYRVDVETGHREHWRDFAPPDGTGVFRVGPIRVTPDGRAYAYSFVRFLSSLYMVEGLE